MLFGGSKLNPKQVPRDLKYLLGAPQSEVTWSGWEAPGLAICWETDRWASLHLPLGLARVQSQALSVVVTPAVTHPTRWFFEIRCILQGFERLREETFLAQGEAH